MFAYDEKVNELVAMAAAIGANCEPCLKFHFDQARRLGVSNEDMQRAVRMAQKVKEVPADKIQQLAEHLVAQPAGDGSPSACGAGKSASAEVPVSPPAKNCCG
jgi:AhpD family alkylhydroperoxidase